MPVRGVSAVYADQSPWDPAFSRGSHLDQYVKIPIGGGKWVEGYVGPDRRVVPLEPVNVPAAKAAGGENVVGKVTYKGRDYYIDRNQPSKAVHHLSPDEVAKKRRPRKPSKAAPTTGVVLVEASVKAPAGHGKGKKGKGGGKAEGGATGKPGGKRKKREYPNVEALTRLRALMTESRRNHSEAVKTAGDFHAPAEFLAKYLEYLVALRAQWTSSEGPFEHRSATLKWDQEAKFLDTEYSSGDYEVFMKELRAADKAIQHMLKAARKQRVERSTKAKWLEMNPLGGRGVSEDESLEDLLNDISEHLPIHVDTVDQFAKIAPYMIRHNLNTLEKLAEQLAKDKIEAKNAALQEKHATGKSKRKPRYFEFDPVDAAVTVDTLIEYLTINGAEAVKGFDVVNFAKNTANRDKLRRLLAKGKKPPAEEADEVDETAESPPGDKGTGIDTSSIPQQSRAMPAGVRSMRFS